jgi:hypothetical protein
MTEVSLQILIKAAKAGKLISFPTDTVPALATIPEQAELIYIAKKRSFDKPLILMAAIAEDLWDYVQGSQIEYQIWQKVVNYGIRNRRCCRVSLCQYSRVVLLINFIKEFVYLTVAQDSLLKN